MASVAPLGTMRGSDRCAQEQVQNIGQIQPHGLLFALSEPDLVVRQASANTAAFLGIPPQALWGRSFEAVLGVQQFEAFQTQLNSGDLHSFTVHLPATEEALEPAGGALRMECTAHRQDGVLVVEIESPECPLSPGPVDFEEHVRLPLTRMRMASNLAELSSVVAGEIRRLTGFHRTMVYCFDKDWNGEVIAEAAGPSPVSYLGMRFPAGDIPPPVRELLLLNRVRSITDVNAPAVPILPEIAPLTGRPLDLTYSVLRSASPIHLEYVRNMGVRSSLSFSIVVAGQLWGLVACHDPEPRRLARSTRTVCEIMVQALATRVATFADKGDLEARLISRILLDRAMIGLESAPSLADAMLAEGRRLMSLFDADGLVARIDNVEGSQGITGDKELLPPVIARLRSIASYGVGSSHELGSLSPAIAAQSSLVSGALYIEISRTGRMEQGGDYLLFLRREMVETIAWAGNPNKSVLTDEHNRLHPRKSFEAWQEVVHGKSLPWTESQVRSALLLHDRVLALRDTRHLARLNEALEAEIVEHRKAELRLTLAQEKAHAALLAAEAAANAKTEFVARMSQELRAPAQRIAAMAGLLLDTALTDEQRRCAEAVRASAASLLALAARSPDLGDPSEPD